MSFTCVCVVTLFFCFDFIKGSQVITKSENGTSNNIDFVEIVKQDLRRNNEDYGETKYDIKLTSTTQVYNGISKNTITFKVKNNDILKINRRANIDSTEYNYDDKGKSTTKEQQVTSQASSNASIQSSVNPIQELLRSQTNKKIAKEKIAKKLNKFDLKKTLVNYSIKAVTNATKTLQTKDVEYPKFVNKDKKEKFKKFMSKNKGLLKDFLSSKMELQTQKTITSNALRNSELVDFLRVNIKKGKKFKKVVKMTTISPELLDMAPARGGRIHRKRVKGRLCQRHVLVPEGPKYDSQGKWYLPAHKLVVSHPYNITHPPKLLLPRCCNCCKKSVLGCE